MESSKLIQETKTFAKNHLKNHPPCHDYEHTKRVLNNAIKIQKTEGGDKTIILLASLLHEINDHKFKQTVNLNTFLTEQNIKKQSVIQIFKIIDELSFSTNKSPTSLESKIIQDADRLEAMGAIGIARTFSYGGNNNRPLSSSIKHFHNKLLKLKDLMNTKTGKQISIERHEFLKSFLQHYNTETN